jgi:hypothetical protein
MKGQRRGFFLILVMISLPDQTKIMPLPLLLCSIVQVRSRLWTDLRIH